MPVNNNTSRLLEMNIKQHTFTGHLVLPMIFHGIERALTKNRNVIASIEKKSSKKTQKKQLYVLSSQTYANHIWPHGIIIGNVKTAQCFTGIDLEAATALLVLNPLQSRLHAQATTTEKFSTRVCRATQLFPVLGAAARQRRAP